MYISDLKIHGFKSFYNKEDLTFGEGITAIVGPNGCGKTNIVDAIRWVLGEQKYSTLRSSKMEDVIFNGAKGLKPLSVSEVTLTVHNNKGKLPIEYNDIEIGRRVYRNGESEYSLNRVPCRLKDINDLFIDTGMGADAYSVIELKMIEQILSETGDDRKRMFEEAAGINKYKSQRKSAFRKFEATRQDLDRIGDIILEVESKVHGLQLQLKRFKRHAKLTEDLKNYDIALAFLKTNRYIEQAKPLSQKISEFKNIRETNTSKEHIHESQLEQLGKTYKDQEQELSQIQQELSSFEEERENLKQVVLVNTEKSNSAISTKDRLLAEKTTNESKQKQLNSLVNDLTEKIEKLDPDIETNLLNYKEKKEEFESIEKLYKDAQSNLETLQNQRWTEQTKLSEKLSLQTRTESMIEEKGTRIDELIKKQSDLDISLKKLAEDQNSLDTKKIALQKKIETSKNEILAGDTELTDLHNEFRNQTVLKDSLTTQIEGLTAQVDFYKELISSGEGLPQGTRSVLNQNEKLTGILGMVADVFQTEEKTQTALESGLGDLAHCLISKDRKTAVETIRLVNKNNWGSVSIIPLKELSSSKTNLKKVPDSENIIGRGDQLIQTSAEFKSLAERLLGNLLVVKDLEKAVNDPLLMDWNLVDLDGVIARNDFILKNQQRSHQGVIGRQKKVEQIEKQIAELKDKAKTANEARVRLEVDLKEKEEIQIRRQKQLDELSVEESNLSKEIVQNHYRQSQTVELIDELKNEVGDLTKTHRQLMESLEAMKPEIEKANSALDMLKKTLEDAENSLIKRRIDRDEFHQKLQDLRIQLLNLENQRDNLNFQKRSAKENVEELEERRTLIDEEIASLEQLKVDLQAQIQKDEISLQKINGKIQHQRSIHDMKKQVYSETYQEIEKIRSLIRSEQQNRESIMEEMKQCEIQIAEFDQKIKHMQERIHERYQIEIPETMTIDKDEETLDMAIQRIERSLEKIGPVNMAVQVEYEEESKRYDLLINQRDDLIESENHLRETIQKIDRVARKQFLDTFSEIKTNYEKLFTLFFEGGQGTLSLIGDPDPLESEIAIYAQPPGKRNQSLRMLSAGEKSLTAIALLFAIYQYKPSPYCILDEVDAPLDDVNILKFTKVLKQFANDTQFLVVTHNKLTMEAADYLYGVTMEQKGVSKLVSVKFE